MTTLAAPLPRHDPLKTLLLDVPPLQDGDRLTRAEFERRYDAMPELKKAELIEGVVHRGSPVSANNHAEPHFDLIGLRFLYRLHTPGVVGGDNATRQLDQRCSWISAAVGSALQLDQRCSWIGAAVGSARQPT